MKVQSIYTNKLLKKGLEFAASNGSLFAAGTSLILSSVARPAVILATPHTDNENKKYACAKSLSSSGVGYLIMALASMPVAKAVKNIDKNPQKYLKKATIETLKNGSESLAKSKQYKFATQLFKLGVGLLVAVPKSAMTCALIPPIMKVLFNKKENSLKINKEKNVSFRGIAERGSNQLSKGIGKILDTKFIQKISEKLHNTNFEQHIISMTDVILTGAFIEQTKRNKKIEENRKKTLIYNSAISTGLCITGGYALSKVLEKPTERFVENFTNANKNSPKLDKYLEGIRVAKPVMILGGIYYLIIPLISTFLADRVGKKSTPTA